MTTYASNTSVAPERTRVEIERTLTRWGVTGYMYGQQGGRAVIAFTAHNRQIRFILPMPDRSERQFTHTPTGQRRGSAQVEKQYDQEVRSRWRALLLIIKAKLEAVESGVVSFEDEFLAHVVLADNSTVSDWIQPQIDRSYDTGQMPPMLPQPTESRPAIEMGSS